MGYHWSIHQLTEYFEAVSRPRYLADAIEVAVERAAEALDAEVAAVVDGAEVLGCIGFGSAVPVEALVLAAGGHPGLEVPSFGALHTVTASLGSDLSAILVLGRQLDDFAAEERQLLQGMARVLGLAMRNLKTLAAERDLRTEREQEAERRLVLLDSLGRRQRLLETLLAIQRTISHRRPLQQILESVTTGASGLLDDAYVALVLADPLGGDQPVVPAASQPATLIGHQPAILSAAMSAMSADTPVTHPATTSEHGQTAVAAPVHVEGTTVGALVALVGSDPLDVGERLELLSVFAEQASLALTDAQTLAEMRQAYHDPLTGLPNRKLFLDRLENAFELAVGREPGVTLLFVDLDRFKSVNDSLGHGAGDTLLAEVAQRIRQSLRPTDTAARLGGDEFAVLLEDDNHEQGGIALAARILQALRAPVELASGTVVIGASIGIASGGRPRQEPSDLLRNADLAMYRAKSDGPGLAVVFRPEMHEANAVSRALEADVIKAVAVEAFTVHYQPVMDLRSRRAVGVEALLRWNHPLRGNVPPLVFIPIAEHLGLIDQLGLFVLRESATQVAAWSAAGPPGLDELCLNVNVSARQLDNATFPSEVARILADTGLPPSRVTLEITETALMREPTQLRSRLVQLKQVGVTLSIDDFGTGYSSLAALSQLPVDQVKLDKTFVDGIVTTPRDQAIVRSVIDLAQCLGLSTVAEGIEHEEQAQLLQDMHCQLGQGYLLARPMAATPAREFLIANQLILQADSG